MKRIITIFGSLAIIVMTIVSIFHLHMAFNLFMGEGTLDIIGRLLVLVGMVTLAFFRRPRSQLVRGGLGAVGMVVLSVALAETFSYQLAIFDGLIYFIGATFLLIEALEPQTAPTSRAARAIV